MDQTGEDVSRHSGRHRHHRHRSRHGRDGGMFGGPAGGILLFLFLALIIAAPIPMGGNRDWAWSPQVMAVAVIAVLCALGMGTASDSFGLKDVERRPMALLIGSFAVMVLFAVLQMLPLLPNPASAPAYELVRSVLSDVRATIPTLSADLTFYTLLKCFGCALFFLVGRSLCRDEAGARLLLYALLVSAIIVVAYGFYMQQAWHSCFVGNFIKKPPPYVPNLDRCLMSGTFVGSNNFACFLGMGLVAAVALLFGARPASVEGQEGGEDDGEEDTSPLVAWVTGTRLALLATILVCLGGILMSGSRAGFVATVAAVLAVIVLMMRGRPRRRGTVRRMIIIGTVIALVVGLIAGGALLRKYASFRDIQSYDRFQIWSVSLDLLRKAPLVGWGMGTYGDAYTFNQPEGDLIFNDRAHSTPYEALDEQGIPVGLVTWLILLVPWWVCLRGAAANDRLRYLVVGAFGVTAVATFHSLVDFSLQIPAIGFIVSAMLGMGWARAFARSD
jgi:O-antigen ligase